MMMSPTGNLIGLILSPMLLINLGWRSLFYIFGMMGGPLIAFWMAMVPSTDPKTTAAAAAAARGQALGASSGASGATSFGHGSLRGRAGAASFRGSAGALGAAAAASPSSSSIGVKELLSKSATWAIIIVNIVNHWGYFIYLNWMPSYFNAVSESSAEGNHPQGGIVLSIISP